MKSLSAIEEHIMSLIDLDKLKFKTENCFKYAFENAENNDIKISLSDFLDEQDYLLEFSGMTIHLFNYNSRQPFFRLKLYILNKKNVKPVAWYEVEYDMNGNILDDYFDLIG